MAGSKKKDNNPSTREKFLGFSLESSRKSYYPQLLEQLQAAKDKEQKLQLLIDNLPARIGFIDTEKRYVLVNREYERVFGKKREDIIGKSVRELVGEENFKTHVSYIDRVLAGHEVHFETPFITPGGEIQWHDISYIPVYDNSGELEGFYVLARDLTERKRVSEENQRLEERLNEAQKFKAIGTLAGGIAHDFNNLLMGIQGRSSLMGVELYPSHPLMEHISAIEEYVLSATHLTRQLLGFARGGKYEVKPVEINDLVVKTISLFGRTRKEIRIEQKINPEAIVVEADSGQIEQVLLNMFVNAWQAMADGGTIFLETSVVLMTEEECQPYEMNPGSYARISVTDTGIGMSSEIKKCVFDPFFTTREKQRGTGLGLASAYGIIKNHGGNITVYSEVGRGSTFSIYLPLSEMTLQSDKVAVKRLVKGCETILLVDDEEMILDVGKSMLQTLGYDVLTARNGVQGVEAVRASEGGIDLVILDMVMPEMDGSKTYDQIKQISSELPIILSSGYSMSGQAEAIIAKGCNGFIQKPFNLSELSAELRKVLDGPEN